MSQDLWMWAQKVYFQQALGNCWCNLDFVIHWYRFCIHFGLGLTVRDKSKWNVWLDPLSLKIYQQLRTVVSQPPFYNFKISLNHYGIYHKHQLFCTYNTFRCLNLNFIKPGACSIYFSLTFRFVLQKNLYSLLIYTSQASICLQIFLLVFCYLWWVLKPI